MNVVCCIARVPDTATRIKVAADGRRPDLEGAQYVINPYDEFALEEAIRMKEASGGELTVLHVGPIDFQKELRNCLAKGADRAVQIQTQGPLGPTGIAELLASKIRPLLPACVFLGKQAVDGDVGATGAMLAHALGLPFVGKISSLRTKDGGFAAEREIEGGIETVEGRLPCVFSAEKGLNEPRRAGLKEIMAAKKKPLETETASAAPPKLEIRKLSLPPERAAGRILGEGAAAVPALIAALQDEAKVI